jgi:hypothetical protein
MDGARRKRPRPKPLEIAAAVGVVLAGVVLIAAIVLVDARWHRIFAVWREGLAVGSPAAIPQAAPAAAPSEPVAARPARAESAPPATGSASRAPSSDTTQVMANILVSQLGQDPAWRTAMANAHANAADSPEHAYWRGVAAAIRDGLRPRP